MPTMDPLTLISGAVFFVCLIFISVAYLLNYRQMNMKTVQRIARKLGLFGIVVILFESLLMVHLYLIHGIALICAVALWVIGLLEDEKDALERDKQTFGVK